MMSLFAALLFFAAIVTMVITMGAAVLFHDKSSDGMAFVSLLAGIATLLLALCAGILL